MPYTTKQLYTAFGVSHQTVKNWSNHFKDYLSPTATPEKDHQHIYTDEDVRVLELVNRLKKSGQTYEMIGAALGTGQRGELPDMGSALVTVGQSAQLAITLQRVKVLEAEMELYKAMMNETEGQNKLLKEQLRQAQDELFDAKYELRQLKLNLKFDGKD